MSATNSFVLSINGGSSSIKFALYDAADVAQRRLHGKIDRIGLSGTTLQFQHADKQEGSEKIDAADHKSAADGLIQWLDKTIGIATLKGVGHRIVHGMHFTEPQRVTPDLMKELARISAFAPDHLPQEIELIEAFTARDANLAQVACFDTAFHRTMPRVAKLLPIPRRFDAQGVQRYGFHGISYSFLMQELAAKNAASGRVILAHLGNGASLAAVLDGKSIDTSMGFTPAAGLPMGTRTGDLDPGVAWHLLRTQNLTPDQFNDLVNHESGLLGVSETSSDMRDLMDRAATDIRAAEAVELFCYQTRKWIGAFSASLGGLDTLVFSGGIGENSAQARLRICTNLEFVGITLDNEANNTAHREVISSADSRVIVRVIPTDEELMIARSVVELIAAKV